MKHTVEVGLVVGVTAAAITEGLPIVVTIAMAAVGAFFHYVIKGPNAVSKDIEKEFEDEKRSG